MTILRSLLMKLRIQRLIQGAVDDGPAGSQQAALELLDHTFSGVADQLLYGHGSSAKQAWAPWVTPAGPFGRLLRDAFAPDWSDEDVAEWETSRVLQARWCGDAVDAFACRYCLWTSEQPASVGAAT